MEAEGSFGMSVAVFRSTLHHILAETSLTNTAVRISNKGVRQYSDKCF